MKTENYIQKLIQANCHFLPRLNESLKKTADELKRENQNLRGFLEDETRAKEDAVSEVKRFKWAL